ncbi:MAG: response regulator transcription factor [Candidatus Dormibacteraceae bacterium]
MTSAAVSASPVPVSIWFPGPGEFSPGLMPGPWSGLPGDPSRRGQDPIHILLIEDDPAIADMYRVQLEFDGFRVTVATTGEIGYTTLVSGSPDIVLLDLLLPDRSGLEIMADIKEKVPTHPPVVILSNYGEPTMMDRGFSLGALEYLVKSRVTPASVSQSIRGWIERSRRERSDHPD